MTCSWHSSGVQVDVAAVHLLGLLFRRHEPPDALVCRSRSAACYLSSLFLPTASKACLVAKPRRSGALRTAATTPTLVARHHVQMERADSEAWVVVCGPVYLRF